MRHAEGSEHVEPDDGPAVGAEMVVDFERHPPIAPATLGRPAPIGAPSFRAAAIQNDLHGGIAGKRTPGVLVELLLVTRDDEDLLGGVPVGVVSTLRTFGPALGKGTQLGPRTKWRLIQELGQRDPGIAATRKTRRGSDFKTRLAIEAQRQTAKRQMH
jgi:hypothetical protein